MKVRVLLVEETRQPMKSHGRTIHSAKGNESQQTVGITLPQIKMILVKCKIQVTFEITLAAMAEKLSEDKIFLGRQAFPNLSCEEKRSSFLLPDVSLGRQMTY